ncbi:MAG: hypothetical protein ACRD1S_16780 [Vicinamibacterales bacterium]
MIRRLPPLLVLLAVASVPLSAAEVLLRNDWIKAHRNRVTVTADFTVDKAHDYPNPVGQGSDDGDMHIAGRAEAIGLPLVLEIVNARIDPFAPVLKRVAAAEAGVQTVPVAGVWRLWFEHPGKKPQQQGAHVPIPKNSNPDHIFELHPATSFDGVSLGPGFVPIKGYTAHEVKKVFDHYEKRVFKVQMGPVFTSIASTKAVFNYAHFHMVMTSGAKAINGGLVANANVVLPDGTSLVASPRRMVFVGGTQPAAIAAKAKPGDRFEAIGIPRVNLDRVWAMAKNAAGQAVDVKGAYELIIVGIVE